MTRCRDRKAEGSTFQPPHPPQAIDLEAVCKSRQHGVCVPPSGKKGRWAEAKWTYKCRVRPWVLRGMALGAGAASAVVVWSEATIGTGRSPDLSPFSIMLHSGARRSEFGEQVLVALPLGYMCACAYFSLLKLGNFSFYHVVGAAAAGRERPEHGLLWPCRTTRTGGGSAPDMHGMLPALPRARAGDQGHLGLLAAAVQLPDGPFRRPAVLQLPARHPHERRQQRRAGAARRAAPSGRRAGPPAGAACSVLSSCLGSRCASTTLTPCSCPAACLRPCLPAQSMVFFQKMGAMSSDVPILGQDFNTWFPLTMLIYVALLVLNWWERCCSRIFIANRFRFEAVSAGMARHRLARAARPCCLGAVLPGWAKVGCRKVGLPGPGWQGPAHACAARMVCLQERADDEHTQRGMRLVQAEEDAISKGWPLGDGIGLFGLGSSSSGLPGGGRSSKQQGQEQSVELNASAGQAKGVAGAGSSSGASSPPLPVSTSRQPLFGGASSSSSGPGGDGGGRNGSPPSKAEAMRQKYANRGSGSTSAAAPPPRDQQQRQQDEDGAVDALFEVVESRPGRVGTSRLLDQSAPSSYSFSWKPRGR